MITDAQKQKILAAIAANRKNYPSDAKHAASLGISTSVYSAIKNGQTEKALSDGNWIGIARRLGVSLRDEMEWKAAKTPTFDYITLQLEASQRSGLSAILVVLATKYLLLVEYQCFVPYSCLLGNPSRDKNGTKPSENKYKSTLPCLPLRTVSVSAAKVRN